MSKELPAYTGGQSRNDSGRIATSLKKNMDSLIEVLTVIKPMLYLDTVEGNTNQTETRP